MALVIIAAAFVWHSSLALPAMVASHFDDNGAANGFIQHRTYMIATLIAILLLPLAVVLPISLAMNSPTAIINVPNRDHWLAPQRRAATVAYVKRQMLIFGLALLAFICYVHWLVVKANTTAPPRLPPSSFMLALVGFATFVMLWVAVLLKRFRNVHAP